MSEEPIDVAHAVLLEAGRPDLADAYVREVEELNRLRALVRQAHKDTA